jgi:hypothetical protein
MLKFQALHNAKSFENLRIISLGHYHVLKFLGGHNCTHFVLSII